MIRKFINKLARKQDFYKSENKYEVLFLHNPPNVEYGYVNEPTQLRNINFFRKNNRVGMIADAMPYVKDNLNKNGTLFPKIIITSKSVWFQKKLIELTDFPLKVRVILFDKSIEELPENWYKNKYFDGYITGK